MCVVGYFERLISAVYNLAYVQALFHVSCKFNEEERQSWITRAQSAAKKCSAAGPGSRRTSASLSPTGNLLHIIIKQLTTIRFYPSEDATVSVCVRPLCRYVSEQLYLLISLPSKLVIYIY